MSPIVSVRVQLTRHEGPSHECDRPWTFPGFGAAERELERWSRTAPKDGTSDKCSVRLMIESGPIDGTPGPVELIEATFRLDLTRAGVPDLRAWLEARTAFYAGHACPQHMTPDQYAETMARYIRDPDLLAFKVSCETLWSRLRFIKEAGLWG